MPDLEESDELVQRLGRHGRSRVLAHPRTLLLLEQGHALEPPLRCSRRAALLRVGEAIKSCQEVLALQRPGLRVQPSQARVGGVRADVEGRDDRLDDRSLGTPCVLSLDKAMAHTADVHTPQSHHPMLLIVCRLIEFMRRTIGPVAIYDDELASRLRLFGARVRDARSRQGLSQEDLAHRAGLHRTYVGGVERGERNVSLGSLYTIADTLGVRAVELLPD